MILNSPNSPTSTPTASLVDGENPQGQLGIECELEEFICTLAGAWPAVPLGSWNVFKDHIYARAKA